MSNSPKLFLSTFFIAALLLGGCAQTQLPTTAPYHEPAITATAMAATVPPWPTPSAAQTTSAAACKRIAFVFNKPDGTHIYSACPDGSDLKQLTNSAGEDVEPAWSPDGTQIAFSSSRGGSNQIFIMNADGSNPVQITSDKQNDMPIWLPGGQQIAFRTSSGTGLWWWQVIALTSKQITQLTQPSYDFFYQTMAWSPDGEEIAYMSLAEQKARNDGASQIHVKDVGGQNDRALTADTWTYIHPIWSPDGSQIAFLSDRDGTYNVYALYVMNSDGTGFKRITQPAYDETDIPTWSPDGKEIAIESQMPTVGNIDIIDLGTGAKRELLTLSGDENIQSPSWQP